MCVNIVRRRVECEVRTGKTGPTLFCRFVFPCDPDDPTDICPEGRFCEASSGTCQPGPGLLEPCGEPSSGVPAEGELCAFNFSAERHTYCRREVCFPDDNLVGDTCSFFDDFQSRCDGEFEDRGTACSPCGPGLDCRSFCTRRCNTAADCPCGQDGTPLTDCVEVEGGKRVCADAAVGIGEPCGPTRLCFRDDAFCGTATVGDEETVCLVEVGGRCFDNADCLTGVCVDGTCQACGSDNDRCDPGDDADCCNRHFCNASARCEDCRGHEAVCTRDGQCCDPPGGVAVCRELAGDDKCWHCDKEGFPCADESDCCPLDDGTPQKCRGDTDAEIGPDPPFCARCSMAGGPCYEDDDCCSGECSASGASGKCL